MGIPSSYSITFLKIFFMILWNDDTAMDQHKDHEEDESRDAVRLESDYSPKLLKDAAPDNTSKAFACRKVK
jgi:hypothetical protein